MRPGPGAALPLGITDIEAQRRRQYWTIWVICGALSPQLCLGWRHPPKLDVGDEATRSIDMYSAEDRSCLFQHNHGYIFYTCEAAAAAILILVSSLSANAAPPTAQELLSLTTSCHRISDGKFRID